MIGSGVAHSTQVQRAVDFAWRFFERETKSVYQFGNNTIVRTADKARRDMVEGKIYELIFRDICYKNGIDVDLDWDIYEGNDNGQDISKVQGRPVDMRFDIKGTKTRSNWLIIESHKVEMIKPHVYIMVQADVPDWIGEERTGETVDVRGRFAGWVYRHNLVDVDGEPWFLYRKGECLYNHKFVTEARRYAENKDGPVRSRKQFVKYYQHIAKSTTYPLRINARMDANKNYGLPISWLNQDLKRLLETMMSHRPV
jgi:hypothetical protein